MDPHFNPLESQDFRRFIAKFLILASLASSLVLILETRGSKNNSAPQTGAVVSANNTGAPPNAFNDTAPDGSADFYKNNVSAPEAPDLAGNYDPTNLTDSLMYSTTQQLVSLNPEGPQDMGGGDYKMTTPDPAKIVADYLDNNRTNGANLLLPVDADKIKTTDKYTQKDVVDYLSAMDSMNKSAYGENISNIKNLVNQPPSREVLNGLNFLFAEAEAKLYNISVPAPFLEMHKALIADLNTKKNMFDVDGNDPLKTALLIKNAPAILKAQSDTIHKSIEKIKGGLPEIMASVSPNGTAGLASLFINEAHAMVLVTDTVHQGISVVDVIENTITAVESVLSYVQVLWEWFSKLLTEIIKDVLVKRLSDAVINWVNGGGKTKFVMNWQGLLTDVANAAAGGVINEIAPGLCSGLAPIIKLSLNLPGGFNQSTNYRGIATRCTLDQVIGNVTQLKDFYTDFAKGGWKAYAAVLEPQNNYFGATILASDFAMGEAGRKAHATNQESTAGAGFLAPKTCVDTYFLTGVLLADYSKSPDFVSKANCSPGPTITCDVTLCLPGGWRTNTPGKFVADSISKAAGSDSAIDRIVNAVDWEGIVGAIVNYAINKIMQSADGLLAPDRTDSTNLADQCLKLYPDIGSQEYADCIANAKTVDKEVGDKNGAKRRALDNAKLILENTSDTIPYKDTSIYVASTSVDILLLIINSPDTSATCTAAKFTAGGADGKSGQLAGVSSTLAMLKAQRADLDTIMTNLPTTITDIQSATSSNPAFYDALLAPYPSVEESGQIMGEAKVEPSLLMGSMESISELKNSCSP